MGLNQSKGSYSPPKEQKRGSVSEDGATSATNTTNTDGTFRPSVDTDNDRDNSVPLAVDTAEKGGSADVDAIVSDLVTMTLENGDTKEKATTDDGEVFEEDKSQLSPPQSPLTPTIVKLDEEIGGPLVIEERKTLTGNVAFEVSVNQIATSPLPPRLRDAERRRSSVSSPADIQQKLCAAEQRRKEIEEEKVSQARAEWEKLAEALKRREMIEKERAERDQMKASESEDRAAANREQVLVEVQQKAKKSYEKASEVKERAALDRTWTENDEREMTLANEIALLRKQLADHDDEMARSGLTLTTENDGDLSQCQIEAKQRRHQLVNAIHDKQRQQQEHLKLSCGVSVDGDEENADPSSHGDLPVC